MQCYYAQTIKSNTMHPSFILPFYKKLPPYILEKGKKNYKYEWNTTNMKSLNFGLGASGM